jgi:hypothetical protein
VKGGYIRCEFHNDAAVKAHMQMFGVERKTARYWVFSAAEVVD